MAANEIERKFVLDRLPLGAEGWPKSEILQGYLAVGADGSEVRLRKKSDQHFLTAKSGGTLARTEAEIEIESSQFDELWPLTAGKRLEKSRSATSVNGAIVEIDVYQGALAGLLVAEVEFSSLQASADFIVPSWFGAEVTNDGRYKNKHLASAGTIPGAHPN